MHHVMMQALDGQELRAILERPEEFGVTRVVFPSQEYRSARAGERNARKHLYHTVPVLPRGDDGGFAEKFLKDRRARDT